MPSPLRLRARLRAWLLTPPPDSLEARVTALAEAVAHYGDAARHAHTASVARGAAMTSALAVLDEMQREVDECRRALGLPVAAPAAPDRPLVPTETLLLPC